MEIGQEVTIFRCVGGRSTFGEKAKLTGATAKHLIFTTESGTVVKTDDSLNTVGKAKANYWSVTLENLPNMINSRVCFWNDQKAIMEYK